MLHSLNSFLARSETFIYNYLTALQGIDCAVVATSRENIEEFPFADVRIISAPDALMSSGGLKSGIFQLMTGKTIRQHRIGQAIEEFAPNVLHAHFGPNGYDLIDLKVKYRLPLVTTFYGYDMSSLPKQKRWVKKYAKLFEHGDLFLVEGPCMKQKLEELGAPAQKVHIQRIAVHTHKYPKWKPVAAGASILFVGRFVEKKGLVFALEAVLRLKHQIGDVKFFIIGSGPLSDQISQFISDHKMGSYVSLLGPKSHSEVLQAMTVSNVLIHPSIYAADGDSEGGAPTILLEAQAIGIPIVSTYHADIPYVLPEGTGVYLCNERDIDSLVVALRSALEDGRPVSSNHIITYHDVAVEARRLMDHYYGLVS